MLINALKHASAASERCAETFLKQAHVIHEASDGIRVSGDFMARIKTAASALHGAYYEIREQNHEMHSLLIEGQQRGRAIHFRLARLLDWLQADVAAMSGLNAELALLKAMDPAASEASALMDAAAHEVMAAYNGLFDAVNALPAFESMPVETVTYPDSVFRAENTAYAPPSGQQKENIESTHAFLKKLFPQWYV